MSEVNFEQVLHRAVYGLRSQGRTTAEIVALIIGEEQRASVPAEPEKVRYIDVQLDNGMTKKYVWTPALQAQLDKEKRQREARG